MKTVYITGHRNPDLDSVCSAYAYAALKNITDPENTYVGIRCGHLSDTVKEQIACVGIDTVPYKRDVFPKVGDVMLQGKYRLQCNEPVFNLVTAYEDDQPSAIPVFDGDEYCGLLSINDITAWFLKDNAKNDPVYNFTAENIASVLPGTMIKRGENNFSALILAGAAAYEEFKLFVDNQTQAVVVLGYRPDHIKYAVEKQVPAIVVTTKDSLDEIDFSSYKGTVYVTKLGTAETIRRLRMSVCVKELLRRQGPALQIDTLFDDAKQALSESRLRGLSVFDGDKWVGFVTRRCFLNKPSNNVILVDHNETGQSIRGIETATVLEIIDHHRLDALKTDVPIYIDAEPVGSTCTIVYQQYLKKNVVPDADIARILLTGIMSDTLILKSPTTTRLDKVSAGSLAALCNVFDIQKFGETLFSGSQSLATTDPEKTIRSDFKQYNEGGIRFGIGQCEVSTLSDIDTYRDKYLLALEKIGKDMNLDWSMLMITDVLREKSVLFVSDTKLNSKLPYNRISDGVFDMPGVLSRKKQLLPEVIHCL